MSSGALAIPRLTLGAVRTREIQERLSFVWVLALVAWSTVRVQDLLLVTCLRFL